MTDAPKPAGRWTLHSWPDDLSTPSNACEEGEACEYSDLHITVVPLAELEDWKEEARAHLHEIVGLREMFKKSERLVDRHMEANADLREKYRLLSQAVNEDDSHCDPECDSFAHTETCKYTSSAAALENRQREINALREKLAAERAHWQGIIKANAVAFDADQNMYREKLADRDEAINLNKADMADLREKLAAALDKLDQVQFVSQGGWNKYDEVKEKLAAETAQRMALEEEIANVLAVAHAPGFDNDGGRSRVDEEMREVYDKLNAAHNECGSLCNLLIAAEARLGAANDENMTLQRERLQIHIRTTNAEAKLAAAEKDLENALESTRSWVHEAADLKNKLVQIAQNIRALSDAEKEKA